MAERLEAETQIADEAPRDELRVAKGLAALNEADEASRLSPEVQELIDRLFTGTEPVGRELKPWEVNKFNASHIMICSLRAAGFRGTEIGKMLDVTAAHVSAIITHPYGVKLVRALAKQSSGSVIDIRTRLDEYASELLDHTFSLAMQDNNVEQVSKVTFGLLDRAGYAAKSAEQGGEKPQQVFDSPALTRLAKAMEGSNSINAHVMPSFVPRRPPDEGALVESEESRASESELGASAPPSLGSQPVAPRRTG